jgi:hypothetical protein
MKTNPSKLDISTPHSPKPVPVLTASGAVGAKANSQEPKFLAAMKSAFTLTLLLLLGAGFPTRVHAATLYAAASNGIWMFDATTGASDGRLTNLNSNALAFAVPEPSCTLLLMAGAGSMLLRRRRLSMKPRQINSSAPLTLRRPSPF